MNLGRVIGTCVATQKACGLSGHRLLVVQPLSFDLENEGRALIAVDIVQSGPGELIAFVRSREAANALPDPFCPVDAAIVSIIDDLGMVRRDGSAKLTWLRTAGDGER
jgi:ethanolamine utilization protein EutN